MYVGVCEDSSTLTMFEKDSTLGHIAGKKVEFLNRETPDFMSTCCPVLT